ncbi:MAG: hypothetical protein H0W44_07570 [Gammaproteobacteria bacterium]|nr:hypothetical protein [Gammaproteobacteria bacterium]
MFKVLSSLLLMALLTGCATTSTYMRLPENAVVRLGADSSKTYSGIRIDKRPFGWGQISGIPYQVEQNNVVISEGKLKARFRKKAVIWPPVAFTYWPVSFGWDCYDLTNATVEACTSEDKKEIKRVIREQRAAKKNKSDPVKEEPKDN